MELNYWFPVTSSQNPNPSASRTYLSLRFWTLFSLICSEHLTRRCCRCVLRSNNRHHFYFRIFGFCRICRRLIVVCQCDSMCERMSQKERKLNWKSAHLAERVSSLDKNKNEGSRRTHTEDDSTIECVSMHNIKCSQRPFNTHRRDGDEWTNERSNMTNTLKFIGKINRQSGWPKNTADRVANSYINACINSTLRHQPPVRFRTFEHFRSAPHLQLSDTAQCSSSDVSIMHQFVYTHGLYDSNRACVCDCVSECVMCSQVAPFWRQIAKLFHGINAKA